MPYRPIQEGKHHIQYSTTPGETLQPGGLKPGELALNTADGALFCGAADGSITSVGGGGGLPDADTDGNTYARKDGAWVDLASAAALQFRQGTDADREAMLTPPASGEPIYTTDSHRLFIGDGTTAGGRGVVTDSDAYVICQPGDDLLAKYTAAKALTPGGNAKSAANRAALIIYPGTYDLGTQTLEIDTDYVDVIGLGSGKWSPSVSVLSTGYGITFGGEDVRVIGLFCGTSKATPGGAKRYIVNCGSSGVFYACAYTYPGPDPDVINGNLIGCIATDDTFGYFCGGSGLVPHRANVFVGTVEDCSMGNVAFLGTVMQGRMRNCHWRNSNGLGPFSANSVFQGRLENSILPNDIISLPLLSVGKSSITFQDSQYGAAVTISNGSPAVVTLADHTFFSGQRVAFSTTGALPSGITANNTYYVKRIDDNTFNVSTSLNGSPVTTSSAGSGTHTVIIPTRSKDAGRYSFCTTLDGEYTTP